MQFFRLAAIFWVVLAVLQPSAEALPPDMPTNLKVDFTRARDSDKSLLFTSYRITWEDKAFNEEGYMVDVRIGDSGAYTIISRVGVNAQVAIATLPTLKHADPKDTTPIVLQFRVTAYKRNGAAIEMSLRPTVNFTVTDPPSSIPNMSTPSGLSRELVGDGRLNLKWTDTNTNEMYYQVLYKKRAETSFSHVGYVYFNTTEIPLQMGLEPGATYDFTVRPTRQAPSDGNSFTDSDHVGPFVNPVEVIVPALLAPTELTGEVKSETTVQITWKDNSSNETGYKIESKTGTATEFTSLGTVSPNTTTLTVPASPASTTKWRVRAVYKTDAITTAIESAPSNEISKDTLFPAPTEFTAVSSAHAGAVELTWKDNTTAESYYDIYTRVAGVTTDFILAMTVPADTKKALVKKLGTADNAPALVIGTEYEFKVRARFLKSGGDISTEYTPVLNAKAREGITSRFYQPATVNVAFTYALIPSAGKTGWSITNPPPGLSFNAVTGVLSGTPTRTGVYECPMTVSFSTHEVHAILTLRILRSPTSPIIEKQISRMTIAPNAEYTITLADKFSDADSEQAVRLVTTLGTIDVLLYPSLAPKGVENFLGYVDAGSYDGVSFHRSIPGFVIQGGGFTPVSSPRTFQSVAPRESPINEPGISNVKGTLSAAKLANNPDSATHDFFINLGPNNDPDNAESLDNQNGGFTVFGRVGYPSIGVVESIEKLPRGNYVDYNDYTGEAPEYDATLDKRVIVDGSIANFQDFPMNIAGTGATAPVDMDVSKTVRIESARRISPMVYTVPGNSVPDVVMATLVGDTLKLKGLKVGTSDITVMLKDLDGQATTQTFTVAVVASYKPPVITRQPVSAAVAPNGTAILKVTATGTSLQYQWRKNGGNISNTNSPTFTVTGVDALKTGPYDVVVSNGTSAVTSNVVRIDLKSDADITANPISRLLKVGDPLELTVGVSGAPEPKIVWTRDNKTVAKQTLPKLSIAAVALTDAGVYKATATNPVKDISETASVCIVDRTATVTTVKEGGKVVLKAKVAGPVTSYQWYKGTVMLEEDETDKARPIQGTKTAVLTIVKARSTPDDSGTYTCKVTFPDGLGIDTPGEHKVAIVEKPGLLEYTAATGVIGYNYDFAIPADPAVSKTPVTFSILELPMGLKLNKQTGHIYGRPLRAGTYRLSTTVSNAAGSVSKAGFLTVIPMPQSAVGTFVAAVEPSDLNGKKGGRLDITVIDQGSYTGKLILNADTYSFAGVVTYFPGAIAPQTQIIIQRKGKTPVALAFVMDTSTGEISGQVTDGITTSSILGFRRYWDSIWNPSDFFAGSYVMGITPPTDKVGNLDVPQGAGYATMTVGVGGTTQIAGKMPDGTVITGSSIVGAFGQFLLYQNLYKKTGSVLGLLEIGTTNLSTTQTQLKVSGNVSWVKDPQTVATDRTYKAGVGPLTMTLLGSTYVPPTGRVMALPASADGSGNAQLDFSDGGLAVTDVTNPDVTFEIRSNNSPLFTAAENPGNVKLTLQSNGVYTGSFELSNPPPVRKVTYQGIVIPRIPGTLGAAATSTTAAVAEVPTLDTTGNGYFLLPQLPSTTAPVTTAKTSPILSGKVILKPLSIAITSQPASVIVNPQANVTFAVVATGQGTLTYQWKKDGITINGATGTSYSLSAVTEAAQASYTVLVSNGSASTTSAAAVLSVNDPLTDVTITRNPAGATVSPEAMVTFTANPVGSGPYVYVWYKDDAVINNAANSTYVIASAALSDAGSYKVKVTTLLTEAGKTSLANVLAVGDPVTEVVASRSPAEATVGSGQAILFSVAAKGTPPLTYQWSKGSNPIDGATNSTYTIASSTTEDDGSYTCKVKNITTPNGVESNAVLLSVTDAVANVVASRSPSNEVIAEGMLVTFSVSAQGASPLSYQWRRNGIPITGATNSIYSFTASLDDAGEYDAVVVNPITTGGLVSNPVPMGVGTAVVIQQATRTPTDTVIPGGAAVTFSVSATGSQPFTYQWRRNSVNIEGATNATYTISSSYPEHAGFYDVIVGNPASSGPNSPTSNAVELQVADSVRNVVAARTPPDAVLIDGQSVVFYASAEGAAPLRYQWRKGGVDIPGATNPTLEFVGTSAANGVYDVVVSNDITTGGIISGPVPLTVASYVTNVSASVSPSTSVAQNQTVVFSVTANGTGPLSYQWRKGNVEIPGATGSTYTIQSASGGDGGNYDVVVSNILSNGVNSVTSNNILLTVTN